MLGTPIRSGTCCLAKRLNQGVIALNNNSSIGPLVSGLGRSYSDGKCGSKDVPQTAGKQVEPWPKNDPPPQPWRCECPSEPQPPNYDPYRIKVPDVVVPPLPPCNAKEIPNEDARELFDGSFQTNPTKDLFYNSPIVHPNYWKNKPLKKPNEVVKESFVKLGFHGRTKYKYAFHEPWNPLDRITLLEQAEKEELVELPKGAEQTADKQTLATNAPNTGSDFG